jgi:hypothetical protein
VERRERQEREHGGGMGRGMRRGEKYTVKPPFQEI